MTSSELGGELRKVCDRIVIVYRGQIAGVLPPDASDVDFGLMMAGKVLREGRLVDMADTEEKSTSRITGFFFRCL